MTCCCLSVRWGAGGQQDGYGQAALVYHEAQMARVVGGPLASVQAVEAWRRQPVLMTLAARGQGQGAAVSCLAFSPQVPPPCM